VHSADAIIFPTPAHHSSSQQLGAVTNLSRLHVVPFGTDLTRFQRPAQGVEAIRARGKGRKVIFALGRHVYYKGFEFLIRALREVPQVHLLLGGRGPLTDELARLVAKLGLADRCEFLGRIPEDALPAHYQACDVFCMPSVERAEAFGFVQLEAMAAGKPVVCCELRNGVTYVNRHGETGLVVPPADPDALAAALRRLSLDDDFRERLGRQARERALREFTLEAMARGTLRVYRNVLEAA